MAFAFKNLASGATNSASEATIYTAPSNGAKAQELTLANNSGADATCTVKMSSSFYGSWLVPGTDTDRGKQITITMNKGLNSGETVTLTWSTAAVTLTHHLSGTELG